MKNEDNFEAFLYYSDNKLSISVQQSYKDSKYYEKSVVLDKDKNNLKLDKLDEFLDLNIFKIIFYIISAYNLFNLYLIFT